MFDNLRYKICGKLLEKAHEQTKIGSYKNIMKGLKLARFAFHILPPSKELCIFVEELRKDLESYFQEEGS